MDTLQRDLVSLAAQYGPRTLLTVGDRAHALMQAFRPLEACSWRRLSGAEALRALDLSQRFDFALVAGALETLTEGRAAILLSRLRDVHSQRFAVLYPRSGAWRPNDFLAMGLFRYDDYPGATGVYSLYTFDIATYKRTPDWLSPRHWAHPELWDKYRW